MSSGSQGMSSAKIMLSAVTACLLWSTAFVGVKIGLQYSTPLFFAGIRFMGSGLLLMPFWLNRVPLRELGRQDFKFIVLVSCYQTFILYGLFYTGMTLVAGATAAIIIGASPLVSAVLAHCCMERDSLTLSRIFSLGIGFAGIVILSVTRLPWVNPSGIDEFAGIVILLLSTISSGYGNIVVARDRLRLDPIFLNSSQIFIGGLSLTVLSLVVEGKPVIPAAVQFYVALIWLSLLSAVAFSMWFVLLKQPGISVSRLNVWKFIIPVFGALFSWMLLDNESPRFDGVAGMVCIATSIVLYHKPFWESKNTNIP